MPSPVLEATAYTGDTVTAKLCITAENTAVVDFFTRRTAGMALTSFEFTLTADALRKLTMMLVLMPRTIVRTSALNIVFNGINADKADADDSIRQKMVDFVQRQLELAHRARYAAEGVLNQSSNSA